MRWWPPILLAALLWSGAATAQTPAPAQPAGAPGSNLTAPMQLGDVLLRARINASLQLQIRLQLHRAKLKREDVWCRAAVFEARWVHLAGQLVSPYICPIGRRTLFLTGTYAFTDARGNKLVGSDPDLPVKAVRVTESRFKWRWSSGEDEGLTK